MEDNKPQKTQHVSIENAITCKQVEPILTILIKNRDIIIYYILHLSYLAMPKFDIHKIVINWSCSVNYLKVKKNIKNLN